jgi:hypothetical protein
VIDLGHCLDLVTSVGIDLVLTANKSLQQISAEAGARLPVNKNKLLRQLDCAVVERVDAIMGRDTIDTARGLFVEGEPLYPVLASTPKITSRSRFAIPTASRVSSERRRRVSWRIRSFGSNSEAARREDDRPATPPPTSRAENGRAFLQRERTTPPQLSLTKLNVWH